MKKETQIKNEKEKSEEVKPDGVFIFKEEEGKSPKVKPAKLLFFNIGIAVAAVVFVVSTLFVVKLLIDYKITRDEYQALADGHSPHASKTEPSSEESMTDEEKYEAMVRPSYDTLMEINSDYIAWLEIPGSRVDYPIVYYSNNEYYLDRTFWGSYSVAGSIFIDYRSGSNLSNQHVVIYGHRMNDGSMFSELRKFQDNDFFQENRHIYLYTETEKRTYEIFSARKVSVLDDIYTFHFDSNDGYVKWLSGMVSVSGYSGDLEFDKGEQTITLSTCVYEEEENRNIIQAYLISREPLES